MPGQDALYVSTPVLLPGGSPLDFFLTEHDGYIHITDDGLTLFKLRGLGYTLVDRRSQRGIASLAEASGLELDDTGAVIGTAKPEHVVHLGQKIQLFIARIVDWEREHFDSSDSNLSLADEVERLMRGKAPNLPIIQAPTIKLSSGDEISFMFLWGTKYVDAMAPAAQSTSARLRKAIQVMRDVDFDLDTLFIVDDRFKPDAATNEVSLLAQVAPAIRLTDFEKHYSPPQLAA